KSQPRRGDAPSPRSGEGLRRKGAELVVSRLDDRRVGLRHLVPGAGEVAQRLGDDDASLVGEDAELGELRMERLERVHARAEVKRPRIVLARIPEGPDALAVRPVDGQ